MSPAVARLAPVALLLAAVALSVYAADRFDLQGLLERMARMPPWLLLLVVLGAPLAGVPLSALLVVLGAAFPLGASIAIAVITFVIHHLLVFPLSRTRLCRRLRESLARRRLLPPARERTRLGDDLLFIFAATWVPGLSYIFKVALTALAGIPFRTYFIAGVLSQTLAAAPYLLLGQMVETANIAWIGAAVFAIAALSWLLRRGLFKSGLAAAAADPSDRPDRSDQSDRA